MSCQGGHKYITKNSKKILKTGNPLTIYYMLSWSHQKSMYNIKNRKSMHE